MTVRKSGLQTAHVDSGVRAAVSGDFWNGVGYRPSKSTGHDRPRVARLDGMMS